VQILTVPDFKVVRSFVVATSAEESKSRARTPRGIAVIGGNSVDELVIADEPNGEVLVFSQQGELRRIIVSRSTIRAKNFAPVDVAVSMNSHELIVSDFGQHKLHIVDLNTEALLRSFGEEGSAHGEFSYPRGICVTPNDEIAVIDYGNNRAQVFRMDGTFVRAFGSHDPAVGTFHEPYGVTCDADGTLVVSDTNNHRGAVCLPDGTALRAFGGMVDFECPLGVTVLQHDGSILVCDTNKHRLQLWR